MSNYDPYTYILRIVVAIHAISTGISWLLSHDLPYFLSWILTVSVCLHVLLTASHKQACKTFDLSQKIVYHQSTKGFGVLWCCLLSGVICMFVTSGCHKANNNIYRHKVLSLDRDKDGNMNYVLVNTYKRKRLLLTQTFDDQGQRVVIVYNSNRNPMFGQADFNGDGKPDEMVVWKGRGMTVFSIHYSGNVPQYRLECGHTNLIWNAGTLSE